MTSRAEEATHAGNTLRPRAFRPVEMSFLNTFRGLFSGFRPVSIDPPARTKGLPPSRNGASSFHLWWDTPPGAITQLAVTVEIRTPPKVETLHFFAIQASFMHKGTQAGGAHLGLQWNPRFPGSRAVNWGGYDVDGNILAGTQSPLISTPDDPNTRDYEWHPQRPYRLKIGPAREKDGSWLWPGSVTDLASGLTIQVRELLTDGDELTDPVIWSEIFAGCDAPSLSVRWSDLAVTTSDGTFPVSACGTAYQRYDDGGCTNTNSTIHHNAFVQTTNADRTNPSDVMLRL